MAYVYSGAGALDYFPCHYGMSRLMFRGPCRATTGRFIAALGSTETYGKYVQAPFSAVLEDHLAMPVANLGCLNAGPDVFFADPILLDLAGKAQVTVLQIMGAQNLSNRFYTVHPRRNDRFLGATPLLRSIYPKVDFTEFNFTRHMLTALQAASLDRFEVVAEELRSAWVMRMKALLGRISGPTVLLWMATQAPPAPQQRADLGFDPILVDQEMIAALRPLASAYVQSIAPTGPAIAAQDRIFPEMEALAASVLPGQAAHDSAAQALLPVIERLL